MSLELWSSWNFLWFTASKYPTAVKTVLFGIFGITNWISIGHFPVYSGKTNGNSVNHDCYTLNPMHMHTEEGGVVFTQSRIIIKLVGISSLVAFMFLKTCSNFDNNRKAN